MKRIISKIMVGAICALSLVFLMACETTQSSTANTESIIPDSAVTKPNAVVLASNPALGLVKGMTGQEVKAVMGDPASMAPVEIKKEEGHAEIWTYKRTVNSTANEIQTGTQSVPVWDQYTGTYKNVEEPVYGIQYQVVDETINLLFFNDRLLEWKQTQETRNTYSK